MNENPANKVASLIDKTSVNNLMTSSTVSIDGANQVKDKDSIIIDQESTENRALFIKKKLHLNLDAVKPIDDVDVTKPQGEYYGGTYDYNSSNVENKNGE